MTGHDFPVPRCEICGALKNSRALCYSAEGHKYPAMIGGDSVRRGTVKSYEEQYFNVMNALADSVMDMSDAEIKEEFEPYEYPTNRCSYLCGPHLEPCGLAKGHRRDCLCVRDDSLVSCILARSLEKAGRNQIAT